MTMFDRHCYALSKGKYCPTKHSMDADNLYIGRFGKHDEGPVEPLSNADFLLEVWAIKSDLISKI